MTRSDVPPIDLELAQLVSQIGAFSRSTEKPLRSLLEDRPDLSRRLSALDPVAAATAFGALLTIPDLQANAVRLESMVNLAVALGAGTQMPSGKLAADLFGYLDQVCGHLEDPAEDVMVGTVRSPWGNFRVLEGLWEGAAFFLQRFVDVIAGMPHDASYDQVRAPCLALLRLSEAACDAAGLERHLLGAEMPSGGVHKDRLTQWMRNRSHLIFSPKQLADLSIEPRDLTPFVLDSARREEELLDATLGNTPLERFPLMRTESSTIHLVLPTAVTSAIRYWIVDTLTRGGLGEALSRALCRSYSQLFHNVQLLGGTAGAELNFRPVGDTAVAEVTMSIDVGRFVHFLFFTDLMANLAETGPAGINSASATLSDMFERRIAAAYRTASADPAYKGGLTLLVGCGIGRGEAIAFGGEDLPNWRIESCPAHDLLTMSCLDKFKPTSLWRMLDARDRVHVLGVQFLNVNGLLNLVAWSRRLDGHIVPHGDMPDAQPGAETMLLVDQNGQRDLRREAALNCDFRVAQFIDGAWVRLRKDAPSAFEDDRVAPLYGSEDPGAQGKSMIAYLAGERVWWADVANPPAAGGTVGYERWRMVSVWLSRAAPLLDPMRGLPTGPVLWKVVFEGDMSDRRLIRVQSTYDQARAAIRAEADPGQNSITTVVGAEFDRALFHMENIAERALVAALIHGAAQLAGHPEPGAIEQALLPQIVTDPNARHSHAFAQRGFRDHVRTHEAGNRLVRISREDDAYTRLNLGWSVRDRALGPQISGKSECTAFLNLLVQQLEDRLTEALRRFDRRQMLELLLRNHELAIDDRDRWQLTSSALLALHGRTPDTIKRIVEAEQRLNAVFQATRILVEMGICEGPLEGGIPPGRLDLSLLMAQAMLLFEIGGWSDAIRWDVMQPELRVTPLGDVHANFDFFEAIIKPHAQVTGEGRIERAVTGYAANLKERGIAESVVDQLDPAFAAAWEEQVGATIDEVRLFVDAIELLGIEAKRSVIEVAHNAFASLAAGDTVLPEATARRILETLTLRTRPVWRDVPAGYGDRDRQPWRFRRRLSFLRRPVLGWDADSATLLIAPGMLRDSFVYMFALYEGGDFPAYQLTPKMAAWQSQVNGRHGTVFANDVAAALRCNGWSVEVEVNVTKLLGRGFDRDYGDVDVLAWRADGRVLIIECKDVQFRKTLGEMAEQLSDFRGEIRANGRRDELRKHLDRMEVIRSHLPEVARYIALPSVGDLESHLMFRNPVPMEFALKRLAEKVMVSNFAGIQSI